MVGRCVFLLVGQCGGGTGRLVILATVTDDWPYVLLQCQEGAHVPGGSPPEGFVSKRMHRLLTDCGVHVLLPRPRPIVVGCLRIASNRYTVNNQSVPQVGCMDGRGT